MAIKETMETLDKSIETEKNKFDLKKTTGKISTTNFWRYQEQGTSGTQSDYVTGIAEVFVLPFCFLLKISRIFDYIW